MSAPDRRRRKSSPRRQYHVRVRGVRRAEPDIRRLGRVALDLVMAEAEAAARADHERQERQPDETRHRPDAGEAA